MNFLRILVASILISNSAFAASFADGPSSVRDNPSTTFIQPTAQDSWNFLRNNPEVLIHQPSIVSSMGPKGVFNTCATDEELRSINPVKTCIRYDGSGENICTEYAMKDIAITRDREETICVSYSSTVCSQWETIHKTYPRDFELKIVGGLYEAKHTFYKSFFLPDCE